MFPNMGKIIYRLFKVNMLKLIPKAKLVIYGLETRKREETKPFKSYLYPNVSLIIVGKCES